MREFSKPRPRSAVLPEISLLAASAFGAGVLNTIAGGGTFLTFPALVFLGLPPVVANATSAVAVFPGYLAGAIGFGRELRSMKEVELGRLVLVTLAGGFVGACLLLVSSDEAFALIVPFLLFAATLIFLFGDRLREAASRRAGGITPFGASGLFLVSVYGGYFNGGLGIVLLALFALWGMTSIHVMNGLKNGLSFVVSSISVATFALAGLVAWPEAMVMMVAASIGGYAGAPIARALPKEVVRAVIVVTGFVMSAVFAFRAVS